MDQSALLPAPLVDSKNPCYCPTESAPVFLTNAASALADLPRTRDQYLISFIARLLYPPSNKKSGRFLCWPVTNPDASLADDLLSLSPSSSVTAGTDSPGRPRPATYSTQASPSFQIPAKRSASLLNNNGDTHALGSSLAVGVGLGKRKYASISSDESITFTDLQASAKRKQSSPTVNMSSFIVTKADPIADFNSHTHSSDLFEADSPRVLDLAFATCSSPIFAYTRPPSEAIANTPQDLFNVLKHEVFGPALIRKLQNAGAATMQDIQSIVDFVCVQGEQLISVTSAAHIPLLSRLFDRAHTPRGQQFFVDSPRYASPPWRTWLPHTHAT
ncbi:hypothetical protein FA95DRAFT_1556530 [Auriscalpium vulgare]|uniref:Uncharacterized protein n=1 Tax=Auriscalpium vulgare TaxID=40419 RepID=A0ACB8S111_9AGAM|nr:hypothetical protein FA95DRAFT_1556530 [Auriscalpium vulgare]